MHQGKEWKFGRAPISAPYSAASHVSRPRDFLESKDTPRRKHFPILPHGSKTSRSLSTIHPDLNTKCSYPKVRFIAFDKEPSSQAGSKPQDAGQGLIRRTTTDDPRSREQASKLKIRHYHSTGSRTIGQESITLSSIGIKFKQPSPERLKGQSNVMAHAPGGARRLYSTLERAKVAVGAAAHGPSGIQFPSSAADMNIHEKLRQFQSDLDDANAKEKAALELALASYIFDKNDTASASIEDEEDHDIEDQQETDTDGSIANIRPQLEPGDLIELTSSTGPYFAAITAVFPIGSIRHIQFVASDSTWGYKVFSIARQPTFAIRRFFEMSELTIIKQHLPNRFLPPVEFGQEQHSRGVLQAEISCAVLEKIQTFQKEANGIYRQHATRIDNAFDLLAKPDGPTFISLEEITRKVLDIDNSTPVPEETLYAVHKACILYNAGFLLDQCHWRSRQFELLSKEEAELIEQIRRWTRQHSENMVRRSHGQEISQKSVLDMFTNEIRPVVLKNRKNRESLTGGKLGPSKRQLDELQRGNLSYKSVLGSPISPNSVLIFKFLKIWSDRKFNYRGRHLLLGLASEILKYTGLYNDDILIKGGGPSNLLKECGVMAPWQAPGYVSGRWSDPYPDKNAPGSKLLTQAQKEIEAGQTQVDYMKELRHDFGNMLVFCIDSASTIDVDDGISLERTSEHGTYWIHVHIANPTAFISPLSRISQLAQFLRTSIYLPDQIHRMLPFDFIREKLSLRSGSPTLTISTKINMDGIVLDRQVCNGFIHNVLHITPDMVRESIGGAPLSSIPRSKFVVGHFPIPAIEQERSASPLSAEAINDLQIMEMLGNAWGVREAKARNHKWSFGEMPRASINVYHQEREDVDATHFRQFFGDPTISLSASPWDLWSHFPIRPKRHRELVESLMQLANNSAAEWCAHRGVPMLYRGCSFGIRRDFNAEAARPAQYSGNIAADFQEFCRRRSNVLIDTRPELSTRKIPHEIVGVNAYLTATSPLRRYDDMINHWQIEAVLREEARLGRPMVEHDSCRFPFPEDSLKKEITKSIDMSRVYITRSRRAVGHWRDEFLTRGILFDECKDLPKIFTLYIIYARDSTLQGVIAELSIMTALRTDQISAMNKPPEVGQIWKVKPEKDSLHSHVISWQLVDRVT